MDSHVVYQAVPIDLNEYFSSSGQSSLLPTFGGNRNNRDDDDNRKKLYLLGGLVVALILLLVIVLPIVHHHHKSEHLHLFVMDMTNGGGGNDQQGEPRVLLKPSVENHAINQEDHSSNKFEAMLWRFDYLDDDEGRFEQRDYIQEEEGEGDDEMFPEYYEMVPLDEDEDEEFEAHRDALAFGIKGGASPKLYEGENYDTDLKVYNQELGAGVSPDHNRVDGLYQGSHIDGNLLFDDEAEQQAMAY